MLKCFQGFTMKNKTEIAEQQQSFIESLKQQTIDFIYTIDKTKIETILLSGSVARGDFFPGKFDGMIDLTVMKRPGTETDAEEIFGKNEDANIPFHCIKRNGTWYEINFIDFITLDAFKKMQIPSRNALLESKILYDPNHKYEDELMNINIWSQVDLKKLLHEEFRYMIYLLGEYKVDRWNRRQAYLQMNENLNAAIRTAIHCLYFINGFYWPAEDRSLYYSLSLEKLPENYSRIIIELCTQTPDSEKDYYRRESLFKCEILRFIEQFIRL